MRVEPTHLHLGEAPRSQISGFNRTRVHKQVTPCSIATMVPFKQAYHCRLELVEDLSCLSRNEGTTPFVAPSCPTNYVKIDIMTTTTELTSTPTLFQSQGIRRSL